MCLGRVPGWSGAPLSSLFKTEPFMLPLDALSEPFRREVAGSRRG